MLVCEGVYVCVCAVRKEAREPQISVPLTHSCGYVYGGNR